MRMREYSESIPKPMVEIGYRPLLWHVMKYYAHFGHTDFILCLGHRGDLIKKYFVKYDEFISNNFVMTNGGKDLRLLHSDIGDWNITFVDTGLNSNIGQRLQAIEKYLDDDSIFLANYADGLTDLFLPDYLSEFKKSDKVGAFLSVKPTQSFHFVRFEKDNEPKSIDSIGDSSIWINGGFFIFKREIFRYIKEGEELVNEPFKRLIAGKQLMTHKHNGFWVAMDTFKDKRFLDDFVSRGAAPWEVWKEKK